MPKIELLLAAARTPTTLEITPIRPPRDTAESIDPKCQLTMANLNFRNDDKKSPNNPDLRLLLLKWRELITDSNDLAGILRAIRELISISSEWPVLTIMLHDLSKGGISGTHPNYPSLAAYFRASHTTQNGIRAMAAWDHQHPDHRTNTFNPTWRDIMAYPTLNSPIILPNRPFLPQVLITLHELRNRGILTESTAHLRIIGKNSNNISDALLRLSNEQNLPDQK